MSECYICGKHIPIDYSIGGRPKDWDFYIICGNCYDELNGFDLKQQKEREEREM